MSASSGAPAPRLSEAIKRSIIERVRLFAYAIAGSRSDNPDVVLAEIREALDALEAAIIKASQGAPTPALIAGFRATEWKRAVDCTVSGWPSPTIGLMVSPFYAGERYAVRDGHGMCLNSAGEWEYEVQPSSRDDAFYERCRFLTFEAAAEALRAALTAPEEPTV